MNSDRKQLIALHDTYNRCLRARVNAWLANANTEELKTEFCIKEKQAYMTWMRTKLPIEYENVMKLEEGNY